MVSTPAIVYPHLSDLIISNLSRDPAPVGRLLSFEIGQILNPYLPPLQEQHSLLPTSLPRIALGLALLLAFHLTVETIWGFHSPLTQHDDLGSAFPPVGIIDCAG